MKRMKKIAVCIFILAALAALYVLPAQAKANVTEARNSVLKNVKNAGVRDGSWVREQGQVIFRAEDGKAAANRWISWNGGIYYLNADGARVTGWISYNGALYYTKSGGKLHTGWMKLDGKKYYLDKNNGRLAKGFQKIGGNLYYFSQADGAMRTGWLKAKDKRYYLDETDGKLVKGFRKIGNYTYCFSEAGGAMRTGWQTIDGDRYYFNVNNGIMAVSRWIPEGSSLHYLDDSGKMVRSGWLTLEDRTYYLDDSGVRVTGMLKIDGKFCHFDKSGVYQEPGTFSGRFIFVGDSRMVGMSNTVAHPNTTFIAKDNTGYDWLKKTAGPRLRSELRGASNVRVVLAHGVNDTNNINNYIAYYRNLIREYPSVEFYVLSVNPLEGSSKYVTNAMVRKFNQSLRSAFENIYIDSYTYLEQTGFKTSDHIHYLASTNQKIYRYIIDMIG